MYALKEWRDKRLISISETSTGRHAIFDWLHYDRSELALRSLCLVKSSEIFISTANRPVQRTKEKDFFADILNFADR